MNFVKINIWNLIKDRDNMYKPLQMKLEIIKLIIT